MSCTDCTKVNPVFMCATDWKIELSDAAVEDVKIKLTDLATGAVMYFDATNSPYGITLDMSEINLPRHPFRLEVSVTGQQPNELIVLESGEEVCCIEFNVVDGEIDEQVFTTEICATT